MSGLTGTFTGRQLLALNQTPIEAAARFGIKLNNNLSVLLGTVLARISAAAVNEIHTINQNHTSGVTGFTISGYGTTSTTVPFNATAAQVLACLETIPALRGNVAVSGTLNSGACNITYQGRLGGLSHPIIALASSTLAGGSATITRSTTGVANDRFVVADLTTVGTPASNLTTYSGTGAGGTWLAGAISIQHTWETAAGESLPSAPVQLVLSGSQSLRVAAINAANTPDAATHFNVYVNGARVSRIAVSTPGTGGNVVQTDIAGPSASDGKPVPTVDRAFTNSDGRQEPSAILVYDYVTNQFGEAYIGQSLQQVATPEQQAYAVRGGQFFASQLPNLTATMLTLMGGRIIRGSFADPANCLVSIPVV